MNTKQILEVFENYSCKYLRVEENVVQGSLNSVDWFNINAETGAINVIPVTNDKEIKQLVSEVKFIGMTESDLEELKKKVSVNHKKTNTDDYLYGNPKNELEFVDDDIKEYFKQPKPKEGCLTMGNPHFKGTPSLMQLVKELRIFNDNFKKSGTVANGS